MDCRVERPRNQRQCQKCERGGGFDVRNIAVDAVLSSVRVECPHEGYGLYITYHKLTDHQSCVRSCPANAPCPSAATKARRRCSPTTSAPCIPCLCTGSSTARRSSCKCHYQNHGSCCSWRRTATFFLVGGVLDIGAPIAMSVVCIRAGASPLPHYVAKLWASGPLREPKGRNDAVKVEMEVTSSRDPGDVAVQELTFFIVPPKLLAGAKLVSLHIQIDKLTS